MKRSSFLKGLLGIAALPLLPKIIDVDDETVEKIPQENRNVIVGGTGMVCDAPGDNIDLCGDYGKPTKFVFTKENVRTMNPFEHLL